MKNNKYLKIFLFIFFSIIYVSFFIFNKNTLNYEIQQGIDTTFEKIEANVKLTLFNFEKISQNIKQYVTNNQEILNVISKAKNASIIEKHTLRRELFEILQPNYLRIKNLGVSHFHFVLPSNESFLRMHKPDKYGDNLTNIRETYNYVHKNKKHVIAFENGKALHAFRHVYPIFKDEEYIGAFEVSYSSEDIQKNLINLNKLYNHFIIRKELLTKNIFSEEYILNKYKQSIEHKDYLILLNKEHKELEKVERQIITPKQNFINKNIKYSNKFSFFTKFDNTVKTVFFYPIKNIKNQNEGYLVIYEDNKHIYNLMQSNNLINILSFFLLIILFIFIYYLLDQKNILEKEVKQKENNLKKSNEIINEFVLFSKTDVSGEITEVSNAFCKITGYKRDELVGKSHKVLKHPDFLDNQIYKEMWEILIQGFTWRGDIKNLTKDGKTYWMDTTISPEYNSNKELTGYIAYRRDISDKKNLEFLNVNLEKLISKEIEKNKLQQKIILKQEKTVALGNMMDAIAHQWKQPLTLLSLNVQNLSLKYEFEEEVKKEDIKNFEKETNEQIKHLITTIDEFRSFFRPNKILLEINIKNLIESTINLMQNELVKNDINVEIKTEEEIYIECIPNELKHVFINLINNSKDAFLERKIEKRDITFTITKENKSINIKYCDNAGGVPKEIITDLFDWNFTTKNKGSGIGLYLSYQIIDKLNGKIEVTNIKDGVCFSIVLNKT